MVKDIRIVLRERAILEAGVSDRLAVLAGSDDLLLIGVPLRYSVKRLGVLDHHVEPHVGLDLLHDVGEARGRDHFDGGVLLRKRQEEIHDTF